MKVTLGESSGCRKVLNLEITPDETEAVRQKVIDDMKKIAVLPGFRPGRAPVGLLERRFKTAIIQEVVEQVMKDSLPKALEETGLKPVSTPEMVESDYDFGGALKAVVAFEVLPDFELRDYRGLEVAHRDAAFDPQLVEHEIQRRCQARASLQEVTGRPAQRGDFLAAAFEAAVAGQAEPVRDERMYLLVEENLKNSLVALQAEGQAIGETRTFDLDFPADYHDHRLAGKTANVRLTVQEIKERVLPALDDAFAQSMGDFKTFDEFRARVETELREAVADHSRHELERRVTEALVAGYDFPVPDTLTEAAFSDFALPAVNDLMQRGMSATDVGKLDWQAIRAEQAPNLQRAVRETMVLTRIAEKEGVTITDADVEAEMARVAAARGQTPEALKAEMIRDEEALNRLKNSLKLRRALAVVVAAARITEPPAEAEHVHGPGCGHDHAHDQDHAHDHDHAPEAGTKPKAKPRSKAKGKTQEAAE
ncbi:MAG TPA: trigger factor [Acidobacteriota bacterium]|nr:trigger factor [Acidobacteriota bacterium]HNR39503.1 trigger factor [Acidobacteriota bacterium]HNU01769.1 trigger factor [Acidobacteriota bacterium]HPB27809.1 trigger factor [Acidobacteriota bacterium]HQO25425.1 trigger factor [Acidobacteriota bacterium]